MSEFVRACSGRLSQFALLGPISPEAIKERKFIFGARRRCARLFQPKVAAAAVAS
jgi:hypothetical protein